MDLVLSRLPSKVSKASQKPSFVSWTTVLLTYIMRVKYYIIKTARSAQMKAWHTPNFCHLMCTRNTAMYEYEGISSWQPDLAALASHSAPNLDGVPSHPLASIGALWSSTCTTSVYNTLSGEKKSHPFLVSHLPLLINELIHLWFCTSLRRLRITTFCLHKVAWTT